MKNSEERVPVRTERFLNSSSRYQRNEVYLTDDLSNEFYGIRMPIDIPPGPHDKFVEVSGDGLRGLAQIAYDHYADPTLWWVIAEVNGIDLPTRDVRPGMVLRVPPKYRISVLLA